MLNEFYKKSEKFELYSVLGCVWGVIEIYI
jgi:hypothetical protein